MLLLPKSNERGLYPCCFGAKAVWLRLLAPCDAFLVYAGHPWGNLAHGPAACAEGRRVVKKTFAKYLLVVLQPTLESTIVNQPTHTHTHKTIATPKFQSSRFRLSTLQLHSLKGCLELDQPCASSARTLRSCAFSYLAMCATASECLELYNARVQFPYLVLQLQRAETSAALRFVSSCNLNTSAV